MSDTDRGVMGQKRSLAPLVRLRDRLAGLTARSDSAHWDASQSASTQSASNQSGSNQSGSNQSGAISPGAVPPVSTESDSSGCAREPDLAARATPADGLTARWIGLEWIAAEPNDDAAQLRIEGFAWRRAGVARGSRVTSVELVPQTADADDPSGAVQARLQVVESAAFNDFSRYAEEDRSNAGFVAVVDGRQLLPPSGTDQIGWRVRITVTDRHGEVTGGFTQRDESATPGRNNSCSIGDGCLAQTGWSKGGLRINVARRAVTAERIELDGGWLSVTARCQGVTPARAVLTRGDAVRDLELEQLPEESGTARYRASGSIAGMADGVEKSQSWYLQFADHDEAVRHVHWRTGSVGAADDREPGFRLVDPDDERLAVRYGPNGVIRIDVHARRLVVQSIELGTDPRSGAQMLQLSGECHGVSDDPCLWELAGAVQQITASSLQRADGHFDVNFATELRGAWAQRPTALPTDDYRLYVRSPHADGESVPALVAPAYNGPGSTLHSHGNRIRISRTSSDHLVLRITEPRTDGETSGYQQRQFQIRHRTGRIDPTDTIFFDSFDGKNAGDNTRAVYEELLRRHPDLHALWTVADLSVEIPPNAEPVIFHSDAWWRALTSSRLLVTNCWLPRAFVRRDHQTVLQTWHGTPLKLLGFDRIGTKRGQAYHDRTRREVAQWDLLVSQNPYSTEIFRSAYGYRGEILEIGYPRDDMLSTADDDQRSAIRSRLGIKAGERVVLYLPTWREKAKGLFSELDFDAVASALNRTGRGRLLVRGHSNTIGHVGAVRGQGVLDVTRYPDLAELYLVADVMITDYSSTMFDYSITGKPMIFFAPDIEQYAGSVRGTYFDLTQSAPGPILKSTAAVIEALDDLDTIGSTYAAPYAAWQQKFNPHDDGGAARRAVDALLDRAGEIGNTLGDRSTR